jgi:diguanylate cyclase (GGDEF)-like protein
MSDWGGRREATAEIGRIITDFQNQWSDKPERELAESVADFFKVTADLVFDPSEALNHWRRLLKHHNDLKRTLGRDPGLVVALSDYFINVHRVFKTPVLVEAEQLALKEEAALLDELTGLYNRRFFNQMLSNQIGQSNRTGRPFALLVVDVDYFKEYNDLYGHAAGDQALKDLAQCMNGNARAGDYLARFGGDEFVLILTNTDRQAAVLAAERHRRAVAEHCFLGEEQLTTGCLTVSIGVAAYPEDGRNASELFQRADEALYHGKSKRNRVNVGPGADMRRFPRFPISLDVLFRQSEAEAADFASCTTENISLGGLLCRIRESYLVGTPLEVVLRSPSDGQALTLKARAVRLAPRSGASNEYHLGVSFEMVSDQQERALLDIIDQYNREKNTVFSTA